jgi:hypothetical protein
MTDPLSGFPRINVDTVRSVVTLSGIVETEAQRDRAEWLTHQVAGVLKVENNIQTQNQPRHSPNTAQANERKVGVPPWRRSASHPPTFSLASPLKRALSMGLWHYVKPMFGATARTWRADNPQGGSHVMCRYFVFLPRTEEAINESSKPQHHAHERASPVA